MRPQEASEWGMPTNNKERASGAEDCHEPTWKCKSLQQNNLS